MGTQFAEWGKVFPNEVPGFPKGVPGFPNGVPGSRIGYPVSWMGYLVSRMGYMVSPMEYPDSQRGNPFSKRGTSFELSIGILFMLLEKTSSEALTDWKSVYPFGLSSQKQTNNIFGFLVVSRLILNNLKTWWVLEYDLKL